MFDSETPDFENQIQITNPTNPISHTAKPTKDVQVPKTKTNYNTLENSNTKFRKSFENTTQKSSGDKNSFEKQNTTVTQVVFEKQKTTSSQFVDSDSVYPSDSTKITNAKNKMYPQLNDSNTLRAYKRDTIDTWHDGYEPKTARQRFSCINQSTSTDDYLVNVSEQEPIPEMVPKIDFSISKTP